MHRFISLATFLAAVFLVDLFASSAFIQGVPAPIRFERAGDFSFSRPLNEIDDAAGPPRIVKGMPGKEPGAFECADKLYSFMLDYMRTLKPAGVAGFEGVDDYIRREGVTNCDELFEVEKGTRPDGNGHVIIQTSGLFWINARSDRGTWVVRETKDGYEVILDAGFVMGNLERKRNGQHSILTFGRHAGADTLVEGSYEFRDGSYRLSKCSSYRLGDSHARRAELSYCE